MKILLANPRGFCAGVDRAIEIVERALSYFGSPIYVRHALVHNRPVVNCLREKGAIFTDSIQDIPKGSIVVFSAHGVSQKIRHEAAMRNLQVFDATCPLVTKVHMEVVRYARSGRECILVGHVGHPEVEGTMGQYCNPESGIYLVESTQDVEQLVLKRPSYCAYVTQTTLSVEDTAEITATLKRCFPKIQSPKKEDICYATSNRQNAVRKLAKRCNPVIVIGSETSSNSNRLKELSERLSCTTYLVDDPKQLCQKWFSKNSVIGVTAGASAPESLVKQVVDQLCDWGVESVQELEGCEEKIVFALPKALRGLSEERTLLS